MLENVDAKTVVTALTARHVHTLDERDSALLFYLLLGYDVKDIAVRMQVSDATVYRWLQKLEERVLAFTTLPVCLSLLRSWATLQLVCCTRATREMIESSRPT